MLKVRIVVLVCGVVSGLIVGAVAQGKADIGDVLGGLREKCNRGCNAILGV